MLDASVSRVFITENGINLLALRDNRIHENLRLEQERIGFGWVESALAALK